ncbi:MAG: class I SAM-dependent methyltransferase [Candidatus Dormibacteraeota bacterium]|nr:class I SAM-dependent methyltransferase [Candidatus Dormibacteraeota bacterium]
MDFAELQKTWDGLAATDPLWAVLTDPTKKGNRWDLREFMATGVTEIEALLARIRQLEYPLRQARALDFGCGVGRLTQALAAHFGEVVGVDISSKMLEVARAHNAHGDRCRYVVNDTTDLRQFPDGQFDLVYSNITLQHVPARYSKTYIGEFLRVLAPGGVAVFQIPGKRRLTLKALPRLLLPEPIVDRYRQARGTREMEMNVVSQKEVLGLVKGHRVVAIDEDHSVDQRWLSYRYFVAKT